MHVLKKTVPKKYSPALRSFALTLNFVSPKAYEYVRSVFGGALPQDSTIKRWYECIDGNPGFTNEAFNALKSASAVSNHKILCSRMIDEVAIKRHLEYDVEKMRGDVDLGNELMTETSAEAKEALVFMLVAVNGSWKLPVAYFLTGSLNGHQKSTLVQECIKKAEESGVQVVFLTFDGAASNISNSARAVGCKLDEPNMKPWFLFNKHKIYVFYDACHMLKLLGNAFGE